MFQTIRKKVTDITVIGLTVTTLVVPLTVPVIAQVVQTDIQTQNEIEISPFTTLGRNGTTTGTNITLQSNSNFYNPGDTWSVGSGAAVVHQGRRVWSNTGWGFFERVHVPSLGRTGYIFSDQIRWN